MATFRFGHHSYQGSTRRCPDRHAVNDVAFSVIMEATNNDANASAFI